jgi:hypothetical protein
MKVVRKVSAQVRGHANRAARASVDDIEDEGSRPQPSMPVVRWLLRPDVDEVRKAREQQRLEGRR